MIIEVFVKQKFYLYVCNLHKTITINKDLNRHIFYKLQFRKV